MEAVDVIEDTPSPVAPSDTQYAIEARGVEKVYGATIALADADLVTRPGEIHALLGENGAGKSTLVRILAGVEPADRGDITLFGESVSGRRLSHGDPSCAFIHQDLSLYASMSVAENIALTAGYRRRVGMIDERATVRATNELLDRLGIHIDARSLVGELPLADQTAVAVARALSHGVRLIVLDEPTAYLEARQVRSLLDLLRGLRSEGVACLLITHRASDVLEVCDSLTVLRNGRTVESCSCSGLSERRLVRLISGDSASVAPRHAPRDSAKSVMKLENAVGAGFGPVSLRVGAGEIVGVCGLADAGAFDLGKAIFGLTPLSEGTLLIDDEPMRLHGAANAVDHGIAYVPPERRSAGLAETMTARENLFMQPATPWFRRIGGREERRRAVDLLDQLDVRPSESERDISTFSGGNQQKIVIAKWLARAPRLLVLNEPTAGVDLAAKADIHARVRDTCEKQGFGVLLISTDFSEVAEMSHRVYVMHRMLIVDELDGLRASPEQLIELAYGGAA